MKKNLITLLLLMVGGMLLVSSCQKKEQPISLQTEGLNAEAIGSIVYIADGVDPKTFIDSLTVTDTLLSIDLGKLTMGHLYYATSEYADLNFQFVVEGQPLTYKLSDRSLTGSPANDAFSGFKLKMGEILSKDSITDSDNTIAIDLIKDFMTTQKANPLAIVGFDYGMYFFEDMAALKPLLDQMGDNVKELAAYKKDARLVEAILNTSKGKKFVDFAGVTDSNEAIKLSEYVGNGQYVLVDFWASWCAPCRREIPNLIKVYNKYKDKGLLVLGVSVWEEKMEDHLKAVEEMKIPYPQIYDNTQNTATDLYGIMGIPQIILFAPDGTVMYRDLRGDMIDTIISELYK